MEQDNKQNKKKPTLSQLASQYASAKLIAHAYHHQTKGEPFFADHAFFGELYEAYDTAFDNLVERVIGLGEANSSASIIAKACEDFQTCVDDGYFEGNLFACILDIEMAFQHTISDLNPDATLGTQNLLAQLADDSETRCYKLSQRVAWE